MDHKRTTGHGELVLCAGSAQRVRLPSAKALQLELALKVIRRSARAGGGEPLPLF
ncbi:hypothetical protein [Streptomyces sp. DSM 41634]|uniref:hypothetical protein n=1 Tax=Streptomyces sp. DSM 41634 TaxID=3448656 RepID=UPI00403FEA6E